MKTNFKSVGRWWNDSSIELIEKNSKVYALGGWNGECYSNCWECLGKYNEEASEEEYIITPVYEELKEDEFVIVDYIIS